MTGGQPLPDGWLAEAAAQGPRLWAALGGGVRVGESAVLSTRVHVLHRGDPDALTVLVDRDAGQLFYGRRHPDEIVHLDIFHAPGALPPAAVAAAFDLALATYRRALPGCGAAIGRDAFDVQTAAGGGRLGGSLRGGRRPGVMAAHQGHVHLAGLLCDADVPFCFALVAAVEQRLAAQGLPPRQPLRVAAARAGADWDLESGLRAYEALTDSRLREPARRGGGGEPPPLPAPEPPAPAAEAECLQTPAAEVWLAHAARLAEALGGAAAARQLLEALATPRPLTALPTPGWTPVTLRSALAHLVQGGWAEAAGPLWRLTARGHTLRGLFARHLREVELALRAAARAIVGGEAVGTRSAGPGRRPRPAPRLVARPHPGERWGELAGPETVGAALTRLRSPAGSVAAPLTVGPEDLRVRRRTRPRRVDLCLLLDASASMEGARMRAARALARHLVLTGRGRVAVLTFQERECTLVVPLTRNDLAVERGLGRVRPSGLTPLAAGLAGARHYLAAAHAKNPLVLLVTDGIPTAAHGAGSPLDEALTEARRFRDARLRLTCIGLEPNEHYLAELVRRAGGRLHVLAELRPEALARLAREERTRLEEGAFPRRRAAAPFASRG